MFQTEVLRGTAPVGAADADSVCVVHHQPAAVAILELDDARQVGEVALHREDAVHDDDHASIVVDGLDLVLQISHVVVAELVVLAEAQAAAVDDARVIQAVEQGDVEAAEQAREDAEIDLEAGGKGQRGLALHEFGQAFLELHVEVERAVEQARAGATGAVHGQRRRGGGLDLRVAGEAEVVVGAQHHELAPLARHHRILGGGDGPVVHVHVRGARRAHPLRVFRALGEDVRAFRRHGAPGRAPGDGLLP